MLGAIARGLVAGAALAPWLPAWPAMLLAPPLAAALARRLSPLASRLLVTLALVLPAAWWTAVRAPRPAPDDVATLAPRRVLRAEGELVGVPGGGATGWRADLRVHAAGGRPQGGLVAVRFPAGAPRPDPGRLYALSGRLARPSAARNPGGFDAAADAARRGVFATFRAEAAQGLGPAPGLAAAGRRAVDGVRRRLLGSLGTGLAPGHAALAGSLAIGAGAAPVAQATADRFRDAGLAHLLAASGAQVALLGGLALGLLRLLGASPGLAAAGAAPVLLLYLALTGAPPGMVRATIMGAIGLVAVASGRTAVPFSALWAAVAGMVLQDPTCVHDLGFQFSVLATYALLRLAAWQRETPLPGPGWAWAAALSPWACQIWVSPWQVAQFHVLPLAALPANWLAAPLAMALTPWGLAVAAVGLVAPRFAALANRLTALGLEGLGAIAATAAGIPGQLLVVPAPGPVALGLAYGALACGTTRPRLALTCAAAALVALHPPGPKPPLTVTFLDVGQGDAIAIRTPGGAWILVDGGLAGPWGDVGTAVVLPFLRRGGCREIALMVATHPHADHVGGLAAIARALPVREAWEAGPAPGQATSRAADGGPVAPLLAAWLTAGTPWRTPPEPLVWSQDGVRLEALKRPGRAASVNDASLVLRLTYGRFVALLAGDLEQAGEAALLGAARERLRADVLKVGHHGSHGATSRRWLQAVRPAVAVISAGAANVHGHPHPLTLARLAAARARLRRTDQAGAITLRTDGARYAVTAMRAPGVPEARCEAGRPGRSPTAARLR